MSTETKFTPGPWEVTAVSLNTGNISVGRRDLRIVIAEVTNAASFGDMLLGAMQRGGGRLEPDDCHTQHANARLIAAAPDLYAALEEFVNWPMTSKPLDGQDHSPAAQMYRMAVRALSKARGEQP